jgi:hypothetical protein
MMDATLKDTIELITAIVSVIITIVAVIVSIRIAKQQKKDSEKLAKDTGAYDRPILNFKILGKSLKNGVTSQLIYGCDFSNPRHILFELPMEIENIGTKTLEDVNIVFNYAPRCPLPIDNDLLKVVASTPISKFKRKYSQTDFNKSVVFFIGQINPKVAFAIFEPILLEETTKTIKTPCKTKDNINIVISAQFTVQYQFEIFITAKDLTGYKFKITLEAVNSLNINDLVEKTNNTFNEKILTNPMREISELPRGGLILVYPQLKKIEYEHESARKPIFKTIVDKEKDVFFVDFIKK